MYVIARVCNKCQKFLGIPINDVSTQWHNTLTYGRNFYLDYCEDCKPTQNPDITPEHKKALDEGRWA